MIYIGIDPGSITGFVQIDTKRKTRIMKGLDFWKCIFAINTAKHDCIKNKEDLKIFIEDPNYNKPVFPSKITKMKVINQDVLNEIRVYGTMAQRVGMNKQEATLLIKYCMTTGIPVEGVKPFAKGKVKGDAFEEVTGIKTNQHCRDAYMILVRKNIIPFNKQQFFNYETK